MQSFTQKVVHFNTVVLNIPVRTPGMLNSAEFDISERSLNEEVVEFSTAHDQGDLIGCVDSMIDLMYFATGVLFKLGLTAETIEASMSLVHDKNMEKKLGVNARRGDGSAADAVKPENWVGPEQGIAELIDAQISKSNA